MKYLLIFLLVLTLFVISITLGAQNDQIVNFNFLVVQGEYRVSTLLAILFGTGFILGWLICSLLWLRVRLSLFSAQRKVKRLEQQVVSLSDTANVPVVKE